MYCGVLYSGGSCCSRVVLLCTRRPCRLRHLRTQGGMSRCVVVYTHVSRRSPCRVRSPCRIRSDSMSCTRMFRDACRVVYARRACRVRSDGMSCTRMFRDARRVVYARHVVHGSGFLIRRLYTRFRVSLYGGCTRDFVLSPLTAYDSGFFIRLYTKFRGAHHLVYCRDSLIRFGCTRDCTSV